MKKEVDFGDRLRELRQETNMTQTRLAEILCMSQDNISLWETNKSFPDYMTLRQLTEIFGVSADFLLCLSDY